MIEYFKESDRCNSCDLKIDDICLMKIEKIIPMYNDRITDWRIGYLRGTPVKVVKIQNDLILVVDANKNIFYIESHNLLPLPQLFMEQFIKETSRLFYKERWQKHWEMLDNTYKNFFCFFDKNRFELQRLLNIEIKIINPEKEFKDVSDSIHQPYNDKGDILNPFEIKEEKSNIEGCYANDIRYYLEATKDNQHIYFSRPYELMQNLIPNLVYHGFTVKQITEEEYEETSHHCDTDDPSGCQTERR